MFIIYALFTQGKRFIKNNFGASSGIRTHTLQGLSLLTLPIGLYSHGALPRIRTETLRLLRPLSLPIGVGGQNKYHYGTKLRRRII